MIVELPGSLCCLMPPKPLQSKIQLQQLLALIHFTERVSTSIHGKLTEKAIYKTVVSEGAVFRHPSFTIYLLCAKRKQLKLFDTTLSPDIIRKAEKTAGVSLSRFRVEIEKSEIFRNVVTGQKTIEISTREIVNELYPKPVSTIISSLFRLKHKDTILTPIYKKGAVTGIFAVTYTDYAEYLMPSVKNLALHISHAVDIAHETAERKAVERELRHSERRYRELTDFLPQPIFEADLSGKMTFANKAAFELFGYDSQDLNRGVNVNSTIILEDRERGRKNLERRFRGEEFGSNEYTALRKDGSTVPVIIRAARITRGKKTIGFRGAIVDISELKTAEAAVRESEEKFRTLAEQSPNMIFINQNGKIVYVNQKCIETMGYSRKEFYSPKFNFLKLIAPESLNVVKMNYEKHLRDKDVEPYEYLLVTKDGAKIIGIHMTKLISYGGQRSLMGIITDITEQRKLEQALTEMEARQQLQIGHDLHDGIGQYLTGVAFKCKALEQNILSGASVSAQDISEIKNLVNQAAEQVNKLSKGLSPIDTQQEGIFTAIEELAVTIEKTFSVSCRFRYQEMFSIDDPIRSNHLYRIAQEAATNAAKHSGTDEISIVFENHGKSIALIISDKGKGIDKHTQSSQGMGLQIMKYRARLIGASLHIHSRKNRGTTIQCIFRRGANKVTG
ncbi:MAG: PAS domain S-box protein [Chitinivibrionales bacterium]|nr:PAS domain S-box protein [Chitinivibrionales bacterium]